MMLSAYTAIIESIKDSSDTGKGIVVIAVIAVASICAIKEILSSGQKSSETT